MHATTESLIPQWFVWLCSTRLNYVFLMAGACVLREIVEMENGQTYAQGMNGKDMQDLWPVPDETVFSSRMWSARMYCITVGEGEQRRYSYHHCCPWSATGTGVSVDNVHPRMQGASTMPIWEHWEECPSAFHLIVFILPHRGHTVCQYNKA